jgi:hypothetical protein
VRQLLDPELVVRRSCGAASPPDDPASGARGRARRALAAERSR